MPPLSPWEKNPSRHLGFGGEGHHIQNPKTLAPRIYWRLPLVAATPWLDAFFSLLVEGFIKTENCEDLRCPWDRGGLNHAASSHKLSVFFNPFMDSEKRRKSYCGIKTFLEKVGVGVRGGLITAKKQKWIKTSSKMRSNEQKCNRYNLRLA